MANPWDNDPINVDRPWENDPSDTPVKKNGLAGKSAKDFIPSSEEQESMLSNIQGLGEAGLNFLTGTIGGGLGTLSGTIAGIRQHGMGTDEARKKVEKEAANQMESLTFQPRTERGKEISGKVGQIMEQLIPIMPMAAQLEGAAMAGKMARDLKKEGTPSKVQESLDKIAGKEAPWEQDAVFLDKDAPVGTQGDLFNNVEVSGPIASPINAAERGAIEGQARGGLANKRQIDLDLEGPSGFVVDSRGQVIPNTVMQNVDPRFVELAKQRQQSLLAQQTEAVQRQQQVAEAQRKASMPPDTLYVDPTGQVFRGTADEYFYQQALQKQKEAQNAQLPMGQQELFPGLAPNEFSPFNPNRLGEVEMSADPRLQRRQMELQLDPQEVLYGDQQGNVGSLATRIVESPEQVAFVKEQLERKMAEEQAASRVKQQGEVFEPVNPYDVGGHVSRLREGDITTVDVPQRELFGESVRPEELGATLAERVKAELEAERGQRFVETAEQGRLFDDVPQPPKEILGEAVPGQPDFFAVKEAAPRAKEAMAEQIAAEHPLVKAAEAKVDKAIELLEALKESNADAARIQKAQQDVGIAKAQEQATKKNIRGGLKGRQSLRKQRGAVDIDLLSGGLVGAIQRWRNKAAETKVGESKNTVMNNIPGIKDKLADFIPEQRSMDEIRAELKTRPDVDQNFVQRLANQFTAGGLYQSLKTNNLMIKKTFETISDAYDRAQKLNRTLIQKDLVPAMRDLSMKEKGEIWAKMMLAEGKETLTADTLRRDGFNEKQIKMYENYRTAADYALKSINDARAAAGKPPVDPRLGYVAGVFNGDFRRVFYKTENGQKVVAGVVGDNTKFGLDRLTKAIKEKHPDWIEGEDRYMGGTGRSLGERQKAFEEALEFLGENDPNVRSLVETYNETMTRDAYNYLNQKKHTKQKRGVEGSEGKKEWQTVEKNALEGMKAQIKYLENSYKWAELSKAAKELQPMLSDPDINMPNAKDWSNKYIDRALGISDNDFGKAIDKMMDGIAKSTGVGPSVISNAASGAKNVSAKLLLGFANLPFLVTNLVQPLVGAPTMASFLASRGLDKGAIAGSAFKAAKMLMERDPKGFNKEALAWADEHGIMTSEIFDHSSNIQKGARYYGNKIAEFGIGPIEEATRATTFFTLSHALKDAGLTVKDGLFETAQKMTNMVMTDYRAIEAPKVYNSLGPMGHLAANLMRFKHNQLSAMSFYAREIKNNKSLAPFGVAMATNIATAGILGTIGFQEADKLYTMITTALGKPDTLTNVVLQNSNTLAAHGIFSAATNIDWSNRLGLQDVVPNSVGEALFPGGNRLVDAAAAVPDLFGTSADRMRASREFLPNSLRGAADRMFFEDEKGRAVNPKDLQPTVERTDTDKFAKTFGLTGVNESDQKAKLYQQRLIDKAYADTRKGALKTVMDDLYTSGKLNQEAMQKYLDAEGDPTTLTNAIAKFQEGRQMTEYQRKLLAASAAGSVNQALRLKRLQEAGVK